MTHYFFTRPIIILLFGPFSYYGSYTTINFIFIILQINLDISKLKTTLHSNATREEEDEKELEGQAAKGNSNRTDSIVDTNTDKEQTVLLAKT